MKAATLKAAFVAALVIGGAWLVATMLDTVQAVDQSRADRAELRAHVTALESELSQQQAASDALVDQIESLGQTPVVDPPIPSKPAVTQAPSLDLLQSLVGMALVQQCGGPCVGAPGESIVGPAGKDGRNGSDGAPGPVGPAGPAGAPGRGVAAVVCSAAIELDLTLTFTDGSTVTVACGPAVEPEPPVEPLDP